MENLLSLAFDGLSSYDGPKIRKGLRQVEGLLAQICLSAPAKSRSSTTDDDASHSSGKSLADLSDDPAFREFFKLQEGFEWNVALRLINTLDRLMGKGTDGQNDLLILSSLDLIQGVLLLHPPSKALFSREQNMNVCCLWLSHRHCPKQSTNSNLATAPPRPPGTRKLSRDPVRHPAHPRHRPH